ncbi:MAG: tRNA (adenosine(37)-N6)-threonylcarbamoyltransferase complex ATPase subunit type 1 TsaE [Bacilli bacterium]|nr:tRNA (adenosine(37)-N6)-threonylcarbamoyltransferase complex ATPase subunit type 1 TsaE [Bacilli bacterium]
MEKRIIINSVNEIIELGKRLGELAKPNMVYALNGDLGAGKTTLTKGIAQGLEIEGIVNSPTFTIMKIYYGRLPLFHMDVYRINQETEDEDLLEYFEMLGLTVIEWANNIKDMIGEVLNIDITIIDQEKREILIHSLNEEYFEVINNL